MRNSRWLVPLVVTAAAAAAAVAGCGGGPSGNPDAAGSDGGNPDAAADATPDADPSVYAAIAIIGALDRIQISKRDDASGICVGVRLVLPEGPGDLGMTLPAGWDVEFGFVHQDLAGCTTRPDIPNPIVFAGAGQGAIEFTIPAGAIYPDELSIDAVLTFPPDEPFAPAMAAMTAANLAVAQ